MAEDLRARAVSYYVWDPPNHAVTVQLDARLIDAARQWIEEASVRGEEAGGILLGRVDRSSGRPVITVDNCEPIQTSHQRGPIFALTDSEQKRVAKRFAVRENPKNVSVPVGFIRGNLRHGLYLDVSDVRLLRAASPDAVYLLVRPGSEPTAGFFFTEDDDVHSQAPYLSFPFESAKLTAAGQTVLPKDFPAVASGTPEVADRPSKLKLLAVPNVKVRVPALRMPVGMSRVWALGALAVCLLLLAAGWLWSEHNRTQTASNSFGLNIDRMGKAVRLTWNPQSGPIEEASNGILWVNDGGVERRLDLTKRQLEHGSALYVPASQSVNFRLQVAKQTDSIWSIAPGAAATDAIAANQPSASQPSAISPALSEPAATALDKNLEADSVAQSKGLELPKPLPQVSVAQSEPQQSGAIIGRETSAVNSQPARNVAASARQTSRSDEAEADLWRDTGSHVASPTPKAARPLPPPMGTQAFETADRSTLRTDEPKHALQASSPLPPPPQEIARVYTPPSPAPSSLTPPVILPQHAPENADVAGPQRRDDFGRIERARPRVTSPAVSVNYQPAPASVVRKGIDRVPVLKLFGRNHSESDDFQPARPVNDLRPAMPQNLVRQMPGEWRVDLQAAIDKHGRVEDVEVLSPLADDRLVRLATDALSRASFEPAQLSGHSVASRLVLTFRFKNPSAQTASAAR